MGSNRRSGAEFWLAGGQVESRLRVLCQEESATIKACVKVAVIPMAPVLLKTVFKSLLFLNLEMVGLSITFRKVVCLWRSGWIDSLTFKSCTPHGINAKMTPEPSEKNVERMWNFGKKYADKSGTSFSPIEGVTEAVIKGLAVHQDTLGRPLCPCRFYQDKQAEIQSRTWICACEDMKNFKYCHCLLFTNEEGMPITEYLPEDHEVREAWGLIPDPTPDKGREGSRKPGV